MNHRLSYFNLAGVVLLVVLCVSQWRQDRQLNLTLNRSDTQRFEQQATLVTLTNRLDGLATDLTDFKTSLADEQKQLLVTETKCRGLSATNEQLVATCGQLQQAVEAWSNAVTQRDQRITEANAQIKSISADLNTAVGKYNALVTNYNAVVQSFNAQQTNPVPAGSGK